MQRSDGVAIFYAKDIAAWRAWLEKNHATEKNIWLIIYHKKSEVQSIYYDDAVDEALCFGWVDSKVNKRDGESYFQYFAKRNPKSNWSRLNKQKVARLLKEGRMASAGLEMIEVAKTTGTWTALDDVENLIVPEDLQTAFDEYPDACKHWENFPRSVKRGILEWILNAKRPATRAKRIAETAASAAKNIRANQWRK
mgnify:CR=1 FL=1